MFFKAIDYDDNCDKGMVATESQTNESMTRVLSQVNEIIQRVTERMQQMYWPPRMVERHPDWPCICKIYGKNHPTFCSAYLKTKGWLGHKPNSHFGMISIRDGETIPQRTSLIEFNTSGRRL